MSAQTPGEFLATRRRRAGPSQAKAAAVVDVSRGTVGRWERGEASPSLDKLVVLLDLYGVPHRERWWLFGGDPERGAELARHVVRLDRESEYGLPCWGCESRDDDGRFQAHNEDCPKFLVAEAKRLLQDGQP